MEELCGSELTKQVNPVWGLGKDGESNSVWRWSGVPNLYFMMGMQKTRLLFRVFMGNYSFMPTGNLAMCRFFSKHIALRE